MKIEIKSNLLCIRALQPPGWCTEWHCGVRVKKSGRLVGFISAIPASLRVYDKYVSKRIFFFLKLQIYNLFITYFIILGFKKW